MKHPFLFAMVLGVITLTSQISQAQTQIASCNSQFMDFGGENSNYLNAEESDWLICPDTTSEYLILEFTHVNIEVADDYGIDSTGCRDILYIYDGMDESAKMIGSYCGQESGDGSEAFIEENTLKVGTKFKPKNSTGCLYIKFESDKDTNLSGWYGEITCCTPSLENGFTDGVDLPMQENGGDFLNLEVDNSCIRDGRLEIFTEFEATGTSCFTKGLSLPHQSFYAFTSNGSGGFVELLVAPVDTVGAIEMLIFGPVELDSITYTGGYINDCVSGTNPWSLFFNAGPNQTYILATATDTAGRISITTLPETVGLGRALPVEVTDYHIKRNGNQVSLNWSTAQEINNDGFEIHRSYDGKYFTQIGWVDGKNSSSEYQFNDLPNGSKDVYYYISQVDLDGKTTDMHVLHTTLDLSNKTRSYPNPSEGGKFTLDLGNQKTDQLSTVSVYNQIGSLILTDSILDQKTYNLNQLAPGNYIIKIVSGNNVSTIQHIIY